MSPPFQEIAFKAELDRHLDPECEYQASILCEEHPDTRASSLEKLRNMIYERGECYPPRMDDAFLLRFLRARRFIPARAHRLIPTLSAPSYSVEKDNGEDLYNMYAGTSSQSQNITQNMGCAEMVRYCYFRERNPHLWRDVYWYGLSRLGNIFEGVLFDRPDVGRLIICRIGLWDPDSIPVEDLICGCLIFLEVGIMQPKLQVLGGTALLDCKGIKMKHIKQLTASVAKQIINVVGFAFPIHQRGIHIINCSRLLEKLFSAFKRFAPTDELRERVYFHGYDPASLHRFIEPECLPKRYGGSREPVSLKDWLTKIRQYKNKQFDEDMKTLGYAVEPVD